MSRPLRHLYSRPVPPASTHLPRGLLRYTRSADSLTAVQPSEHENRICSSRTILLIALFSRLLRLCTRKNNGSIPSPRCKCNAIVLKPMSSLFTLLSQYSLFIPPLGLTAVRTKTDARATAKKTASSPRASLTVRGQLSSPNVSFFSNDPLP